MTIKKLQIVLLGCVLSANVLAANRGLYMGNDSAWPIVVTISAGPAWARPGQSQTLTLQPEIQKSFVPHKTSRAIKFVTTAKGTDTLATGELFLGLYGAVNSVVEGQIGVVFEASSQARLGGVIYEDANLAFNNYSYSYQIRNSRIALKAKGLYNTGFYDALGYLSGSAGVGYNHSSSFRITPLIDTEVAAPTFTDHTSESFSYTFGVGIETPVDPNWRVGVGYEWAAWGMSQLDRAPGQTVGSGLRLGNLRAQAVIASISYIA